jgi:hypothetical protein
MINSTNANGKEIQLLTSLGEYEECKESVKSLLHFLCNTTEYGNVTPEDIENAGVQLGELMARLRRFENSTPRQLPTFMRVTSAPPAPPVLKLPASKKR